ncbi:MAG: DUF167 domain-containing protein [Candidatus Aenigmatarchaeota archaeon]
MSKETLLEVKVKPDSDEFSVEGFNKWTERLEVKLSQPAKNGKANKELTENMSDLLGKKVLLKSGRKSRKKTLAVKNITSGRLKEKL